MNLILLRIVEVLKSRNKEKWTNEVARRSGMASVKGKHTLFKPIVYVGVKARLNMCIMGNQCQCWSQRATPTALDIFVKPFFEPKANEQLRPPASMIPVDMIAPIFVRVL